MSLHPLANAVAYAAISCVLFLSGCATPTKMAFQDDAEKLTEQSRPVFLMKVTIKNAYKTSYQPKLLVVNVEKPQAKEAADRINFTMDDKGKDETGSAAAGNTYFVRMQLDPGRYEIRGLTSMIQSFPIMGSFFAPLHSPIEAKAPGVYYLGYVSATVRERQGNEFRAGPPVPLLDQAVSGASGGTFDVEIADAFATDEAQFRSKFPALGGIRIQKAILPPFDRAKAQQWWEAH
jgi:hypothetical protein